MTRPDHCPQCGAYQCDDCADRANRLGAWAVALLIVAALAVVAVSAVPHLARAYHEAAHVWAL